MFTEAYKARSFLLDVADRYGYQHRQFSSSVGAEGPDIAALVRVGIPITRWQPMKMTEPWWGPSTGKKRDPRVYAELTLADDDLPGDQQWKHALAHFPPGGPSGGTSAEVHGRNKAAWFESRDRTTSYGNDRPWGPFAIIGDLNATHDEIAHQLLPSLDGPVHLASLGDGASHAAVRGATVTAKKLNAPVGHGWGIFTLTVNP